MARWVLIRRYHVREGVLVERSVLESAGIQVLAPDLHFYGLYPHIADTSFQGYCLFVLEDDVEDARAILNLRDERQTSYPCPETGKKTRRLKNIWGTIALSAFFWMFGGPVPAPLRRRMRICNESRVRFLPEPPAPFTAEELGYPPPR